MNMMTSAFNTIVSTLRGTPLWVWAILAYLLFVGIRATKDRSVHPLTLLIIPIILMGINHKILLSGNNLGIYMNGVSAGLLIGFLMGFKIPIKILHHLKRIELPGNHYTIAFLLLFFLAKYTLGYLEATKPLNSAYYLLIDTLISGLLSGYFVGMASSHLTRYYQGCK